MVAAIYSVFFVCVIAFAACAIWQSIASQKGRITALLSEDHLLADSRILTVSMSPALVFLPTIAPDFGSSRLVALSLGSPLSANQGWLVGQGNIRSSFAAGNWTAKTSVKQGTSWHSPYSPRAIQARPDYRLQPFTSRKLQPHLVIAN